MLSIQTPSDQTAAPVYDGRLLTAEDFMVVTIGNEITVRDNVRAGEPVFDKSGVVDHRMAPAPGGEPHR